MKRYAKRALFAWLAFELLGAVLVAAGGKSLTDRLKASLEPKPSQNAPLSASR